MDLYTNNAYPTPLQGSPALLLVLTVLANQKNAPEVATDFKEEYDYIVVGAGSAGSVVASRLSEVPCARVLLLEAGPSPPLLNDVPLFSRYFRNTNLDWTYKTVSQKYSGFGLENNQVIWPSGKGLGGSSLLSAMTYVRGNKKNYDEWARNGAIGWSYSDVKPYFFKLEDNNDPQYIADGFHVAGGPMSVQRPKYVPEMKKYLLQSALRGGYEFVDPNGRQQTGFYDLQANLRNGQRCSSAKGYLVPAETRTNLDILVNARVRKVLIENGQAFGVEFDYKNQTRNVTATREVIVSAGAVNTAQVLQLSGIGPREHLESLNIPVHADLPVGNNFHDHSGCPVPIQLSENTPNIGTTSLITSLHEYELNKTGIYSSPEGISLMAFLNNPDTEDPDVPDYEHYYIDLPQNYAKTQFGLTEVVYEKTFGKHDESSMMICLAQTLHPRSRGTVRLHSANPYDPPLIDPNYYADDRDVWDIVNAIKKCIEIATAPPMYDGTGAQFLDFMVPGCEQAKGDAYWACFARTITTSGGNPVGTAKIGDPDDPSTVVDPELKVKGISKLRVVDASVMPTIPTGDTNVPTLMIAEKGADMIKSGIPCKQQLPIAVRNDPPPPMYINHIYETSGTLGTIVVNTVGTVGKVLGIF